MQHLLTANGSLDQFCDFCFLPTGRWTGFAKFVLANGLRDQLCWSLFFGFLSGARRGGVCFFHVFWSLKSWKKHRLMPFFDDFKFQNTWKNKLHRCLRHSQNPEKWKFVFFSVSAGGRCEVCFWILLGRRAMRKLVFVSLPGRRAMRSLFFVLSPIGRTCFSVFLPSVGLGPFSAYRRLASMAKLFLTHFLPIFG